VRFDETNVNVAVWLVVVAHAIVAASVSVVVGAYPVPVTETRPFVGTRAITPVVSAVTVYAVPDVVPAEIVDI
jgi:hypothetical protein